jgi:hypothetical protein
MAYRHTWIQKVQTWMYGDSIELRMGGLKSVVEGMTKVEAFCEQFYMILSKQLAAQPSVFRFRECS